MKLFPMSPEDYKFWSERSRIAFASDKQRAERLSHEAAETLAREGLARLLPQGRQTPDHHFYVARDEAQNLLGFLWLAIRNDSGERRAFVYDIIIEEAHRGRGHGRSLMLLAEAETKRLGFDHLGLHVFGFNHAAIALYRSLGYATIDMVMEKPLS
ncbi:MAG TPA: GNAT family N-acetyltransferase [Bdellovibrionota bacterium]|jgi:ribosomal protein S18 acetylase RimI-like enzyme|nr:GNAT family N-acetyltransferase [Bdellovibrionota bacterium]